MTSDPPRHRLATISSSTPSCQLVPVTRNIAEAAAAPAQAKPAKSRVGRVARSAIAPTKTSTSADTMVERVRV